MSKPLYMYYYLWSILLSSLQSVSVTVVVVVATIESVVVTTEKAALEATKVLPRTEARLLAANTVPRISLAPTIATAPTATHLAAIILVEAIPNPPAQLATQPPPSSQLRTIPTLLLLTIQATHQVAFSPSLGL